MTNPEWRDEVQDAIAGTGWRIVSSDIATDSDACYADLKHKLGKERLLRVSRSVFKTSAARRAEIMLQLGLG